jgi:carbamoyltransferase
VTHVDGTARVQSVSQDSNPLFWQLLGEFEALTGLGVVLNTSFNNHAEPIVDSLDDAVTAYLTTNLTHLVIGHHIVMRRDDAAIRRAACDLWLDLPPWRVLVARREVDAQGTVQGVYEIASVKSKDFGPLAIRISADLHDRLVQAQRTSDRSLADLGPADDALIDEVLTLWSQRVVRLRPRVGTARPLGERLRTVASR